MILMSSLPIRWIQGGEWKPLSNPAPHLEQLHLPSLRWLPVVEMVFYTPYSLVQYCQKILKTAVQRPLRAWTRGGDVSIPQNTLAPHCPSPPPPQRDDGRRAPPQTKGLSAHTTHDWGPVVCLLLVALWE